MSWYRAALVAFPMTVDDNGVVSGFGRAKEWELAIANLGRSLAWAGFGAACELRGFDAGWDAALEEIEAHDAGVSWDRGYL